MICMVKIISDTIDIMIIDCHPFVFRYLEMCLTKGAGGRKADGRSIISRIAINSIGRDLAFDFVRDRWDEVVAK